MNNPYWETKEKFYTFYEIPKVKFRTPGRDYDDEGNVCSWYIEEQWPEITGDIFFELLQLYLEHHDPYNCKVDIEEMICMLFDKMLYDEKHCDFSYKQDVKEIFQPYLTYLELGLDEV